MDFTQYLDKFQEVANQLDKQLLEKKQIEVSVGRYLDSAFLKLYKKSWTNNFDTPPESDSKIFFSVWINDLALREQKLFYNIHALKLRQLNGYSITSRNFADAFRMRFKGFEHQWKNVSVKFGPQTLMEGWTKINLENFQAETLILTKQFFQIDYLIDETLEIFKQPGDNKTKKNNNNRGHRIRGIF